MKNPTNLDFNFHRYLQNPQSNEARAFFEGARAIMKALQLASPDNYAAMLSTSNQQHIIALLVQSSEQQNARRRKDVQQLLKAYKVNKREFLAFVFDLPEINMDGQGIDSDGTLLEDNLFCLLPGKVNPGWPDYKIRHYETGREITRSEYLQLSELEQMDYCYDRFLPLYLNGTPALRISSSDRYLMEELIRQSILIGDSNINRRYLTETYCDPLSQQHGLLYDYRDAIIDALVELRESNPHVASITPMVVSQVQQGYITSMGQYLIARLQSLSTTTEAKDLLKMLPDEVQTWKQIIQACQNDDDATLAKFITDDDIAGYQNASGNPLPGAVPSEDNQWAVITNPEEIEPFMQKDFFKHVFVEHNLSKRLAKMINCIFVQEDVQIADANPGILEALLALMDILPSSNDQTKETPNL